MKTHILAFFLALFMVFGYVGCSKNSGGSSGTSDIVTTGITGTVTNMEGLALANVTIYSEGNTTTTDESGLFSINTSPSSTISLTAELDNYARNTKIVAVTDAVSKQNIKLAKVDTITTFDTANGATIKAKGATVDLPLGTYTLDDGTTYSGDVTIQATYNRVTTVNGSEAYPGEFLGESATGDTKVLQSYGFIDVTLQADNGDNVNLKSGALATLTYPMDPNIEETPATIPLWYFDTQKGIWVEDGVATYDVTTNTYIGTVGHFSTWNLDAKFDGAVLKGCVEDSKGNPLSSQIFVSTAGWNNYANHTITNDDANGEFELYNAPSNIPMSIIAKVDDLISQEQNITLTPNNTTTLDKCLVVELNASNSFSIIKGKVTDAANKPISNINLNFSSTTNDINSYIGYATSDNKGEFSLSVKKSELDSITIAASYNSINFDNTFIIKNTSQSPIDVGTIELATTTINACVTLEKGSTTSPEDNVTTLADGVTTVNDGTIISADGYTTFGTDKREFAIGNPYNVNSYNPEEFSENGGLFTLTVQKDNLNHNLYANTHTITEVTKDTEYGTQTFSTKNYTLTGSLSFIANSTNIDLTNNCIELSKMDALTPTTAKASISSTNKEVHTQVVFVQNSSNWGDIIAGDDTKDKTLSFTIDKNGKYIVQQVANDFHLNITFNGTMSLVLNGKTYTITLPESSAGSEWWTAFSIEVYNGTITVTEVNKAW